MNPFKSRSLRTLLSLSLLLAGMFIGSPVYHTSNALADPTTDDAWTVVSTPNAQNNNELWDVAAYDTGHVWAVGRSFASPASTDNALVLYYDGVSWTNVTGDVFSSFSLPYSSALFGVAVLAKYDVWLVGRYAASATDVNHTLIMHFDTTGWHHIASPDQGTGDNELHDVAFKSASAGWAVGIGSGFSLSEYWDGTQWTVIDTPGDTELYGVSIVSGDDVWAVGDGAVIEHWSPSPTCPGHIDCWQIVDSPHPSSIQDLNGVSAVSTNDVWAVGLYRCIASCSGQVYVPFTVHWDGTRWTQNHDLDGQAVPTYDALYGVAAIASDFVWTAGFVHGPSSITLTGCWNGTNWKRVTSPSTSGQYPSAVGVVPGSTTSGGTTWSVGYQRVGTQRQTFAMVYHNTHHACP
jgi:hypothetical protein